LRSPQWELKSVAKQLTVALKALCFQANPIAISMASPVVLRRSARIAAKVVAVVVPDEPKKVKLSMEELKERRLEAARRGSVTRKLCFEKLEELPVTQEVAEVLDWPTIDQVRSRMEECGIKSYFDMQVYARKTFAKLETYAYSEVAMPFEKRMLVLVCTESMLKYRSQLRHRDWRLVDVLLNKLIEGNYPDHEYLQQWQVAHSHLYPDMLEFLYGK